MSATCDRRDSVTFLACGAAAVRWFFSPADGFLFSRCARHGLLRARFTLGVVPITCEEWVVRSVLGS